MDLDDKTRLEAKERYLTALHAVDREVRSYADELPALQEGGSGERLNSLATALDDAARQLREARLTRGEA